jgi:hypothetical protein
MPRETRVTGCETRREAVSAEPGNGSGSADGRTTELRLVGMQHRVHRQAAMSACESGDQPGGTWVQQGHHVWCSGRIEDHRAHSNGERQGGKQRREAVLLSTRRKSSKGAERSGKSRRCPSEPLTAWKQGGTGVGEPEDRVDTGNRVPVGTTETL